MPFLLLFAAALGVAQSPPARRPTWQDLTPIQAHLTRHGLSSSTLARYLAQTHDQNVARVRQGDLDHLVFYLLQSTRFTKRDPIEPALSAKSLVEGLREPDRNAFLRGGPASVPPAAAARIADFLRAIDGGKAADARLAYFRSLVEAAFPARADRRSGVASEYLRAMRFLYEKEFVAQRSAHAADEVARLYRSRGLSTDTAVEAGFVVREGLGIAAGLDPGRKIRRVLIVGPGLDIAPRTAFNEASPPQSYQPWAVMDAVLSLKLSAPGDLRIVAADINPRVVEYLNRSRTPSPALRMATEIREGGPIALTQDYREYFTRLGSAVGTASRIEVSNGRLTKTVRIDAVNAAALSSERLDIVTERLGGAPFDLIVATNILPYFDDTQVALALANIASMLAPGGLFVHNEPRPAVIELMAALGVAFEQLRQVKIADVRGGAPLADSLFVHRSAMR